MEKKIITKTKKSEPTPKEVVEVEEVIVEKKKTFFEEFKEFILRGNVIELAVGLTVGTAFTKVVNSLVTNLLMPIIGLLLKGETFSQFFLSLDGKYYESLQAAVDAKAPILRYGQMIADLIDFIIIALAIFFVVKLMNRIHLDKLIKKPE